MADQFAGQGIGPVIQARRIELGLTQLDVATKCGKTQAYISAIEARGTLNDDEITDAKAIERVAREREWLPSPTLLYALCDVLKMKPETLLIASGHLKPSDTTPATRPDDLESRILSEIAEAQVDVNIKTNLSGIVRASLAMYQPDPKRKPS